MYFLPFAKQNQAEVWPRFQSLLKLLLWTKGVEWVKVLNALGPLCLWKCFSLSSKRHQGNEQQCANGTCLQCWWKAQELKSVHMTSVNERWKNCLGCDWSCTTESSWTIVINDWKRSWNTNVFGQRFYNKLAHWGLETVQFSVGNITRGQKLDRSMLSVFPGSWSCPSRVCRRSPPLPQPLCWESPWCTWSSWSPPPCRSAPPRSSRTSQLSKIAPSSVCRSRRSPLYHVYVGRKKGKLMDQRLYWTVT